MDRHDIGFLDRSRSWSITERRCPHWIQAGAVCFVTWRLADSLPNEVLSRLDREVAELRRRRGLQPTGDGAANFALRVSKQQRRLEWELFMLRDEYLGKGYGHCWLADPQLSMYVLNSLRRFDEQRYFLTDAVVMPNHVHYLAAFQNEDEFLKQNTDWKRFTAREINRRMKRRGTVWQSDQFDHLVRSPEHFVSFRRYIAQNPQKAFLSTGRFRHFQKDLES